MGIEGEAAVRFKVVGDYDGDDDEDGGGWKREGLKMMEMCVDVGVMEMNEV